MKIEKMEDLPECFQCGSVLSDVLYHCNEEEAVEFCKDLNLSEEWINWVIERKKKVWRGVRNED